MCNLNSNNLNSISSRFPRGQIIIAIPLRVLYGIAVLIARGIRAVGVLIRGR